MRKPLNLIPDDCKINFCIAVEIVARHAGISKRKLLKDPSHKLAVQRFIVFALMDSFDGKYSNIDVGSLAGKDHSTVINGQKVHSEMYETNHEKTYRDYYDKIYEEFMSKLSIESIEELDPQKKSMFQVISEINKIEMSLKKVKDVLIESYLEGFELNEEIRNELKSIL